MKLMLSVAALAAIVGSANAQVLFETDFEDATTYPIGSQLNTRPGWDATGNAGFVVTDNVGPVGNAAIVVNTATWTANANRFNWVNTPVSPAQLAVTPIVLIETDVAILSGGGTRRTQAGIQGYSAAVGLIGGLTLRDDGGVNISGGTGAGITASLPAGSLPLNTFFRFGIEMNFATQTQRFLIDGVAIDVSAVPGLNQFDETDFNDADLFVQRTTQASGTGGTTGDTAIFDNYKVQIVVPAPGAMALAGLAGFVGIRRRR